MAQQKNGSTGIAEQPFLHLLVIQKYTSGLLQATQWPSHQNSFAVITQNDGVVAQFVYSCYI